jgi:pimeloyl-ACP methyl ester carboxylesterase
MKRPLLLILACSLACSGLASAAQRPTHKAHEALRAGGRFSQAPKKEAAHNSAGSQDGILRGRDGEVLGTEKDPEAALGGSFGNPFALQLQANLVGRNLVEFTIDSTQIAGSAWSESFLVGFPSNPIQPTPVLVLFHGYGETPQDVLANSDFFEMGMQRGWIVVAPLGAHTVNYGIEYSQLNVEAALALLAGTIAPSLGMTVDADRFYAVGFSMGGGGAASFVARHADTCDGLHFAGTAIHTGSTSLSYTYWSTPGIQTTFDSALMFGGPPNDPALTFDYTRCSATDIDWATGLVDPTTDMVRNLTHMPVLSYYANQDPNSTLIAQTTTTHHQFRKRGGKGRLLHSPSSKHDWQTLNERRVFRMFKRAFQAPTALTRTLADRDGDWHGFNITQATTRVFSPFRWIVLPQTNRLVLDEVANIQTLKLASPTCVGLNPDANLDIIFNSADSVPLEIVIGEIDDQPSDVWLGGVSTSSWSYDVNSKELTLFENAQGNYLKWTVFN